MIKPIQERYLINDIETLKIVADGRRMQILRHFKTARTVKDVAELIGSEPGRLYYHVNLLEKHGLIRVVETNVVSGIIEKRYQCVARQYEVDTHLLATETPSDSHIEDTLQIIFDSTKNDVRRGIKSGEISMATVADEPEDSIIWRMVVSIDQAQLSQYAQRLTALLDELQTAGKEVAQSDSDCRAYGVTLAFYPMPKHEPAESRTDGEANHE
jgi:DNA-binding transcriptional ArsR family regulator